MKPLAFSHHLFRNCSLLACFALLGCNQNQESKPKPTTQAGTQVDSAASPRDPASPSAPAPVAKAEAAAPVPIAEEKTGDSPALTDAARLEAIQKRYAEVTTKNSLIMKSHTFECVGGEVNIRLRRYFEVDQLAQAAIEVAFPGHASERYEFIYSSGQMVFAIANENSWGFSSEVAGDNTVDTITQRRYYFDNGETFRCLKKKVKGPTKQVDKLLEQATNQEDDCAMSRQLKTLAAGMLTNESEPALIKESLCKI